MDEAEVVQIAGLGAKGDGLAATARGAVFVPWALPGETWQLGPGEPQRVGAGVGRAEPPCPHFKQCGGCVAQHMEPATYDAWKHGIVVEAFRHRGLQADVAPLVRVAPGSRRRAVMGVERRGRTVAIGFREEGQHTLVDLETCVVLDPAIVAMLPGLREIGRLLLPDRDGGRLVVTKVDDGLDCAFERGRRDLSADERAAAAALAERHKIVRLVSGGDIIVERGRPRLTLGGVEIVPEPGVFLQAVPSAEADIIARVAAAVPKRAKTAVDLFCGVGTLTFPLARRVSVTAFDSDKRAVAALVHASRQVQGLKPIDARTRDLFREPLSARELDRFDLVVFDPPRAGAQEQAERIAKSKVATVIAVSCNPATLARDARLLIDGGFAMGQVVPIDQFLWSAHVEAVAVFTR